MAVRFLAANQIQHGIGGKNVKVFQPGDVVSGLTAEQMRALWDSGSLIRQIVTPKAAPVQPPSEEEKGAQEKANNVDE